jgi:hypothetical protein
MTQQKMKKNLLYYILLLILMLNCSSALAQYQYVGTYNWDGKPNNLVTPSDIVTAGFKVDIGTSLPENHSVAIYNPQFIADIRLETISLSASSDVWISFLNTNSSGHHALGYYTYPTDAPLATAPANADIKIIFANAAKTGSGGSLSAGDKVWIGNFPANTSIGFVIIVNGWDNANNKVGIGNWRIFSNSAFNPETNADLRKHFVSLYDTTSNRIVLGFEETLRDPGFNSDNDFNDLLFYATVSPTQNVSQIETIPLLSKDGSISFSGKSGGLESKSLGDAISKRVYTNAINSTQGPIDYKKLNQIQNPTIQKTGMGVGNALQLKDILPSKILDSGYSTYISTSADITSITNAIDVVSVDFTINNECRAVVFATKTLNQMYDHSKAVCDRLKGAELLGMENFNLKGLNFVRYTLLQPNGHIEYAISFSIGMKLGRNSFSFQSNWLNKDYIPEEILYNIQVWSATPYLSVEITLEILNKLNAIMPVQALFQGTELPKAYIISGKREGRNINFNIHNATTTSIGYFQIEEKQSEKSIITTTRRVPVIITANGKSTTSVPVSDSYESTISLYLNNKLQDVVFMADGSWNIDYNKNTTVVNSYNITNDSTINNVELKDVLPVFRNVSLNATTSDQVTAYKLLKGGGAEEDLRAYKSLKFTANATGANMRITLVKNSIANWNEQYSYYLPISNTKKEYSINLSDFSSTQNNKAFTPNDITTIIFSFEVENGKSTEINASISKVSFTKQSAVAANTILTKNVQLYPNPSKGRFIASFNAEIPSTVTLKLLNANTGRQLLSKKVNTIKGENNVNVELNQSINTNVYILTIEGFSDKYLPKKLMVQQ